MLCFQFQYKETSLRYFRSTKFNLINVKNIIGEFFDKAANMRGDFNGLQAYIRKEK
jgi:hypothetical protein